MMGTGYSVVQKKKRDSFFSNIINSIKEYISILSEQFEEGYDAKRTYGFNNAGRNYKRF